VGWIAEGVPAPAGALAFADTTFGKSKIGGFIVITDELARSADPAAEMLIQRDLSNAIVAFSDQAFLDPALEAVVDVSPASVTNGATEIESTGDTAEEVTADLKAAFAALAAAGIQMSDPYIVMKPTTALFLAGLENAAGVPAFPNVTVAGGSIWGVPVLTSASVGDRIVVLDAAEILLAEGGLEVEASNQATVEMAAPADSPPDASTVMTSLWQENLTGVMVRRYIRWQRRRAGATAFVSGVSF
jgi:HK97 family phage major capsid protein